MEVADMAPGSNTWRKGLTLYLSGPTNAGSIPTAINNVFFALLAFFVRLGSGLFGGPSAAI